MIVDDRTAIAEFKLTILEAVRSLPLTEARTLLKGLMLVAGPAGGADELRDLRLAYTRLCQTDDQLELIASDQLKLRQILEDPV